MLRGRSIALFIACVCSLLALLSPSYAWGPTLDTQAQGLAHYMTALCLDFNGDIDQAIREYQKSVHFDPSNTFALNELGSIYADHHLNAQAIPMFRRSLRIDPGNAEALNSLAYIYAEEGVHLDQAIRMAHQAISQQPTNGAYYDSLGWALFKKGDDAESLNALQKARQYIQDEILDQHINAVQKALNHAAH